MEDIREIVNFFIQRQSWTMSNLERMDLPEDFAKTMEDEVLEGTEGLIYKETFGWVELEPTDEQVIKYINTLSETMTNSILNSDIIAAN